MNNNIVSAHISYQTSSLEPEILCFVREMALLRILNLIFIAYLVSEYCSDIIFKIRAPSSALSTTPELVSNLPIFLVYWLLYRAESALSGAFCVSRVCIIPFEFHPSAQNRLECSTVYLYR